MKFPVTQKQIARLAVIQMDNCFDMQGREIADRQGDFHLDFDAGEQGDIAVFMPWMSGPVLVDSEGNVR